jgi:drug/metabolite transporter (DMT)-like permease
VAVLLALFSAVVYGVSDYGGGRATKSSAAVTVTLAAECTTFVALSIVMVVLDDPFPARADVLWGLAAGLASCSAVIALYHALANGAMTVVAPVTAVVAAVIPVAFGLATGERPGAIAIVGAVVAITAIALISGAVGVPHVPTRRGILGLALIAGAGFGLLFVFLDRTSDDSGLWPVYAARWIAIPTLLVAHWVRRDRRPLTRTTGGLAVMVGVLTTAANASFLAATRRGLLSVVAVVVSMYPASTVLLATVLDGERVRRPQAVGLGLAGLALVLVTISR